MIFIYIFQYEFREELSCFFIENFYDFLDDMIAILIHDDLHGINFYNFDNFCLNFEIRMSIFNYFLNDPASIAMQANKQKLFLGKFINAFFMPLATNFNVLLNNIVAKLIIDEDIDMLIKILKNLIL